MSITLEQSAAHAHALATALDFDPPDHAPWGLRLSWATRAPSDWVIRRRMDSRVRVAASPAVVSGRH